MSTEPEVTPSTPPAEIPPATEGTPPVEPAVVEPPAPVEPITFEALKFPEGFTVDETASKSFVDLINDEKLTRAELAQKLVDMQADFSKKTAETLFSEQTKLFTEQSEKWVAETKADPEIGGDKLEPVLGRVATLVKNYGSPELNDLLDASGMGNNPVVIKFLNKLAMEMSEGSPVSGAPTQAKPSLASKLYPSMK